MLSLEADLGGDGGLTAHATLIQIIPHLTALIDNTSLDEDRLRLELEREGLQIRLRRLQHAMHTVPTTLCTARDISLGMSTNKWRQLKPVGFSVEQALDRKVQSLYDKIKHKDSKGDDVSKLVLELQDVLARRKSRDFQNQAVATDTLISDVKRKRKFSDLQREAGNLVLISESSSQEVSMTEDVYLYGKGTFVLSSDGSFGHDNHGGSGMAHPLPPRPEFHHGQRKWRALAFPLGVIRDSNQSERLGLRNALQYLVDHLGTLNGVVSVVIETDSKNALTSVMEGLCDGNSRVPEVSEILDHLKTLKHRGINVKLAWVKGHHINAGNFIADLMAGFGRRLSLDDYPIGMSRDYSDEQELLEGVMAAAEAARKHVALLTEPRAAEDHGAEPRPYKKIKTHQQSRHASAEALCTKILSQSARDLRRAEQASPIIAHDKLRVPGIRRHPPMPNRVTADDFFKIHQQGTQKHSSPQWEATSSAFNPVPPKYKSAVSSTPSTPPPSYETAFGQSHGSNAETHEGRTAVLDPNGLDNMPDRPVAATHARHNGETHERALLEIAQHATPTFGRDESYSFQFTALATSKYSAQPAKGTVSLIHSKELSELGERRVSSEAAAPGSVSGLAASGEIGARPVGLPAETQGASSVSTFATMTSTQDTAVPKETSSTQFLPVAQDMEKQETPQTRDQTLSCDDDDASSTTPVSEMLHEGSGEAPAPTNRMKKPVHDRPESTTLNPSHKNRSSEYAMQLNLADGDELAPDGDDYTASAVGILRFSAFEKLRTQEPAGYNKKEVVEKSIIKHFGQETRGRGDISAKTGGAADRSIIGNKVQSQRDSSTERGEARNAALGEQGERKRKYATVPSGRNLRRALPTELTRLSSGPHGDDGERRRQYG